MKEFCFDWSEEYYLIHVQFDSVDTSNACTCNRNIIVCREFEGNEMQEEKRVMTNEGFRFIISRSCPEENKIIVKYDDDVILKAYLIDDRAYYPTKIYFER